MAWQNNRETHVPTKLREACLTRDNHQCTVTMQNGQRCPEVTALEAAHIHQRKRGETLTVDKLTTKCHWHHNRETQGQAKQARQGKRPNPWRDGDIHPALR